MDDITGLLVTYLDVAHKPIPIYRENQKGAFSEPSFFVQRVSLGVTPRLFNHQDRSYRFNVVYFPNPERPNEDMDLMAEWFASDFGKLPFAHFTERELVRNENELHFSFTLSVAVGIEEAADYLKELAIQRGLKRG